MTKPPDQKHYLKLVTPRLDWKEPTPTRPKRREGRIEMSCGVANVRSEALDEIWWRGKQWAVTKYGIECLDRTYYFAADRLVENPDYLWPRQMNNKSWVDIDEFTTAWMVALVLHGQDGKLKPEAIREVFGRLRPIGAPEGGDED